MVRKGEVGKLEEMKMGGYDMKGGESDIKTSI